MTINNVQAEEVVKILKAYTAAIETGSRDETQAFAHMPVAYVTENDVQMRERYPFDPAKLRELTGFHHAEMEYRVIHMDHTKAHVLVEGTRHRADNTVIEAVNAVYIMQRRDGDWKIAAFSGIRTPA